MSTHHHLAGLPEWADAQTAADAVAALGLAVDQAQQPDDAVAAARQLRADWSAAAAGYWAKAAIAMKNRDFNLMRTSAKQATDADQMASPEGVLMAAIFGGCQRTPPAAMVQAGRNLPADLVKQARQAVQANMAAFAAQRQAQPKQARPAKQAAAATPDQQRVIDLLKAQGPMKLDPLKDATGMTTTALLAMERKGLIVLNRRGQFLV